jgi:hypothetical protein
MRIKVLPCLIGASFFSCVLCASVVKILLILGLFILFLNQIIRCSRSLSESAEWLDGEQPVRTEMFSKQLNLLSLVILKQVNLTDMSDHFFEDISDSSVRESLKIGRNRCEIAITAIKSLKLNRL